MAGSRIVLFGYFNKRSRTLVELPRRKATQMSVSRKRNIGYQSTGSGFARLGGANFLSLIDPKSRSKSAGHSPSGAVSMIFRSQADNDFPDFLAVARAFFSVSLSR